MKRLLIFICVLTGFPFFINGQTEDEKTIQQLKEQLESYEHRFDVLEKKIDDLLWFRRMEDLAIVDKVLIYGDPPAKVKKPNAVGANNPLKFWAYVFIPQKLDPSKKYPLIVFPHGGVHANFDTYYTHIVRELIAQEYIVIAPDYRGSTGYGQSFYERIDYGGLEISDADASRQYMIENYPFVDKERVGIFGWSHGGLISLMCLFEYPGAYQVGFAGVPVSDLVMRMGYRGASYEKYFSAEFHIGETVLENTEAYKKRSPVFHVKKLQTPLLIHTNTNDDDVFAIEVMNLINALKAEGKKFEYEVYENLPGGHTFDRMDTRLSREIRFKTYQFMAKYLEPNVRFKKLSELEKFAYPGLKH